MRILYEYIYIYITLWYENSLWIYIYIHIYIYIYIRKYECIYEYYSNFNIISTVDIFLHYTYLIFTFFKFFEKTLLNYPWLINSVHSILFRKGISVQIWNYFINGAVYPWIIDFIVFFLNWYFFIFALKKMFMVSNRCHITYLLKSVTSKWEQNLLLEKN